MAGARLTGVAGLLDAVDDIKDRWAVDNVVWEVGSNVEYAIHVEYGTSNMSAQPYMRKAVEDARRKLDRFAGQANSIKDLVKTIALYIEKRAKEIVPVDTGNLKASIKAVPQGGGGSGATTEVSL